MEINRHRKLTPMAAGNDNLHVVMFPWLAFGHLIPFLELSKSIAQKGHKVSFISTPRNIDRLPAVPTNLAPLITFVKLKLPRVHKLRQDAEATTDIRTDDIPYLKTAYDGLEPGLTRFLETESPDWIIYDFSPHWLPPVAARLGVSRAFFSIFNAWFIAFSGSSSEAMINGSDQRIRPEDFTVPPSWIPFPNNVAYRLHEINWVMGSSTDNESGVSDFYRAGSVISGSEVVFVRYCNEFEPEWIKLLEELHKKPVIPLGLMPPSAQDRVGDQNEAEWLTIKEWLDSQDKGSVVYVALGSEATLSQNELTELGIGLELSGLPFFWVLRKPPGSEESNPIELPDGFLERIRDRGIVWMSWVPQLKILGHESVGGFLSHLGWSSIIEGLMFGRPLVMLPFLVDQGLNARVLVDNKVGIEVPRNETDGLFTRDSVAESLRLVMVEEEGRIYRERTKELSGIFGDKELHNRYMDTSIKYLENHTK